VYVHLCVFLFMSCLGTVLFTYKLQPYSGSVIGEISYATSVNINT
jgi:hypothetical protein